MDDEEENKKKAIIEVNNEQAALIHEAVTAAVKPLQREITSLREEVKGLKKTSEKPNMAVMDEETRKEIKGMMVSATSGIDSYRFSIYGLFGISVILACTIIFNSYRLSETEKNMDWKYDVVTGILSGDQHYWWNGENYEASRKAPEAKRLQESLEKYQKINEQLKKQSAN